MYTFPLLSFALLLVPSITFVKCVMIINSLFCVWKLCGRVCKRHVPKTDQGSNLVGAIADDKRKMSVDNKFFS